MSATPTVRIQYADVEGTRIHYLGAGEGEAVLLLHGWPTSSHLYRNIIPALAETHRVIAPDLPGFGQSDKPLDRRYSFGFHEQVIEGLLMKLSIDRVTLVVHDLGGPVGLYWATRHPEKVIRLALLNTLVYPEFSWAVKMFGLMTVVPGLKMWLAGPDGIAWALRLGVERKEQLTPDVLRPYQAPFEKPEARHALLKTAQGLGMRGFREIAAKLPEFRVPVRLIYGANDRILPDIAQTMARIKRDLPQAEITALPGCGHFLQEDEPERVAELLGEFIRT